MDTDTKALVESLQAVGTHAGTIANALTLGNMTPKKQREYADMLKELSELLHEHADLQEGGGVNE
ncbi:hypothetical protein [Amycolatopsis sp. CA-126428]|uniref:hypothetical protein n=1 Tax=Amycolatopsis sp. CA-126428 TaxID=2073158 RepID=UPI001E64CBE4|nr:hypothetical protein [Amycolatopsis sp. CA-126428]